MIFKKKKLTTIHRKDGISVLWCSPVRKEINHTCSLFLHFQADDGELGPGADDLHPAAVHAVAVRALHPGLPGSHEDQSGKYSGQDRVDVSVRQCAPVCLHS